MELDYVRHKVVKMKLCTLSMQRFQVEFLYLEFRGAIGTHNNIIERRDTKLLPLFFDFKEAVHCYNTLK